MARNKYPGRCYCCGEWIEPGYGHFEKVRNPVAPRNRQAQVRNSPLDTLLFQMAALYDVPCAAIGDVVEQGQLRPPGADFWLLRPLTSQVPREYVAGLSRLGGGSDYAGMVSLPSW